MRPPFARSVVAGVISASAFWIIVIFFIFVAVPDPQSGIALSLSPFYAVFVGLMVSLLYGSTVSLRSGNASHRGAAVATIAISALLLAAFLFWFISELAQAYHPA